MKMKCFLMAAAVITAGLFVQNTKADFFYDGSNTAPWAQDRYAPNLFTSVTFPGPQPAYAFGIASTDDAANRPPAYSSTFYNTQGYQTAVNGVAGAWSYSSDLYVNADMLTGTYQPMSTGPWVGTGVNSGYYLMEFMSGVSARAYTATASASSRSEYSTIRPVSGRTSVRRG